MGKGSVRGLFGLLISVLRDAGGWGSGAVVVQSPEYTRSSHIEIEGENHTPG